MQRLDEVKNEYVTIKQLTKVWRAPMIVQTELGNMLGLYRNDTEWLSPSHRKITAYANMSSIGRVGY